MHKICLKINISLLNCIEAQKIYFPEHHILIFMEKSATIFRKKTEEKGFSETSRKKILQNYQNSLYTLEYVLYVMHEFMINQLARVSKITFFSPGRVNIEIYKL